jgi:hypothetical protein
MFQKKLAMNRSLFLVLVVISQISSAQNFLIKQNGETIPYRKMKFKGDSVQILDEERDKVRISEHDIAGYFDVATRLVYFQKPQAENDPYFLLFPNKKESKNYEYMPLREPGKINIFERVETAPPSSHMGTNGVMTTTYNSTTFYYAQKENHYGHVFTVGALDKKKVRNTLKTFIDDDPETLTKLESTDFQFNNKNFFRLIREYNLKHFIPPTGAEYRSSSNVSIYTRVAPKLRSKIKITVNDSIEFSMPGSSFPLPVALPNNAASKVCITVESNSHCRMLLPCPYALHYYEAEVTGGGKSIDLEFRSESQYRSYLSATR